MSIAPYTAPTAAVVRASSANPSIPSYYSYTKFRMTFLGFADNSATVGNPINAVICGISAYQSGLTIGSHYYLADTLGTMGTSPRNEYPKNRNCFNWYTDFTN